MYYFYIIYSATLDRYYTGYTLNLEERIRKHNTHHRGYTGKTNDWKLVYMEEYSIKKDAYQRERQVKKWKNRKQF
jgi:putative endonuclease